MIDPFNVTKYDRSISELQEFLLFCIFVSGKRADIIANKLNDLFSYNNVEPFSLIKKWIEEKTLDEKLRKVKMGKYSHFSKGLKQLIESNLNLKECSVEDLEAIHGIGPKTSRYFILHTRKNQRIACLDTHILTYLRELGHSAPKTTPSGKKYQKLEKIFIDLADKNGKNIADFDLEIWKKSTKSKRMETANV